MMDEVIKYFERLEERLAEQDARIAALEAEVEELKNRPLPEPQIVEKVVEKIVEKPVEVIKEVVKEVMVEKPTEPEIPLEPETPEIPEEPVIEEIAEEPVKEAVDPKAAIYGKAVEDIRQAISLGDRFLYQRELFSQNAELMQRTLTELNALSSFDEAIAYISAHFQWDTESSTYQQFLVTLHRRFG